MSSRGPTHTSSTLTRFIFPVPLSVQCITDALRGRGLNTSTALPDDVLNFVRRHPLMAQQVLPSDRRPLLFSRTTDYTHMAVHTAPGADGRTYHVLYVGTGATSTFGTFLAERERLSFGLNSAL